MWISTNHRHVKKGQKFHAHTDSSRYMAQRRNIFGSRFFQMQRQNIYTLGPSKIQTHSIIDGEKLERNMSHIEMHQLQRRFIWCIENEVENYITNFSSSKPRTCILQTWLKNLIKTFILMKLKLRYNLRSYTSFPKQDILILINISNEIYKSMF